MKTFGQGLLALAAGYCFSLWTDSMEAGGFMTAVLGLYIIGRDK